jgi:hypothetical protein
MHFNKRSLSPSLSLCPSLSYLSLSILFDLFCIFHLLLLPLPLRLCSDAFTNFDNAANYAQNSKDVRDATLFLYESVIPSHAEELLIHYQRYACDSVSHLSGRHVFEDVIAMDPFLAKYGYSNSISGMRQAMKRFCLAEGYHAVGINCRHIGRVRSFISDPGLRHILLGTCVSRVIKRRIENDMRTIMRNLEVWMASVSFLFQSLSVFAIGPIQHLRGRCHGLIESAVV